MNGQLPSHPAEALPYIRVRLPEWAANRLAIGVSESALAAAQETLAIAEEAQQRAVALRQEALAAAQIAREAAAKARRAASVVITQTQAHAIATDSAEVYALAGLRVPARRVGGRGRAIENRVPSKPLNLSAILEPSTGHLTVTWEGRQPRGVENVTYEIRRSIDGGSIARAETIGFAGATPTEGNVRGARATSLPFKSFVDQRVPIGTASVSYFIIPRCGGRMGPVSDGLVVNLGAVVRREGAVSASARAAA